MDNNWMNQWKCHHIIQKDETKKMSVYFPKKWLIYLNNSSFSSFSIKECGNRMLDFYLSFYIFLHPLVIFVKKLSHFKSTDFWKHILVAINVF